MFIDEKTGNTIHAELDNSVSHATLRNQDLLGPLQDVLRDTPEYVQITFGNAIPAHIWDDENAKWWNDEAHYLIESLFETLNNYAPEGYYFGSHIGDGSDFGFWRTEEQESLILQ